MTIPLPKPSLSNRDAWSSAFEKASTPFVTQAISRSLQEANDQAEITVQPSERKLHIRLDFVSRANFDMPLPAFATHPIREEFAEASKNIRFAQTALTNDVMRDYPFGGLHDETFQFKAIFKGGRMVRLVKQVSRSTRQDD
jgi:hypothetical protein